MKAEADVFAVGEGVGVKEHELPQLLETSVAEYFYEPAVLAATMLAGVALAGVWRPFGAGLLIAAGTAGTLHFVGVLIAAARAIGEPGEVGPAGLIGALGGLLVVAAGVRGRGLSDRDP